MLPISPLQNKSFIESQMPLFGSNPASPNLKDLYICNHAETTAIPDEAHVVQIAFQSGSQLISTFDAAELQDRLHSDAWNEPTPIIEISPRIQDPNIADQCTHCKRKESNVWRQSPVGLLCNSCGIFRIRNDGILPVNFSQTSTDSLKACNICKAIEADSVVFSRDLNGILSCSTNIENQQVDQEKVVLTDTEMLVVSASAASAFRIAPKELIVVNFLIEQQISGDCEQAIKQVELATSQISRDKQDRKSEDSSLRDNSSKKRKIVSVQRSPTLKKITLKQKNDDFESLDLEEIRWALNGNVYEPCKIITQEGDCVKVCMISGRLCEISRTDLLDRHMKIGDTILVRRRNGEYVERIIEGYSKCGRIFMLKSSLSDDCSTASLEIVALPKGGSLFSGYCFIMTGFDPVRSKETDPDVEDQQVEIDKTELRDRIKKDGGAICELEENILQRFATFTDKMILISLAPKRTGKYLIALGVGMPCVSAFWINDCLTDRRIRNFAPYLMSNGYSIKLSAFVGSFRRPEKVFNGLFVHVSGCDKFSSMWDKILAASGAFIVQDLNAHDDLLILSEKEPSAKLVSAAGKRHIVNTEWVIQTLIHQELADITDNFSFKL